MFETTTLRSNAVVKTECRKLTAQRLGMTGYEANMSGATCAIYVAGMSDIVQGKKREPLRLTGLKMQ